MYHQDWLMRQIELLVRYVASLWLGKGDELRSDIHLESEPQTSGDARTLDYRLSALVGEEQLCWAENLLFEAVEEGDPEALSAGLRFYSDLNRLSDETLERCGFPRDEILSGLQSLCDAYGCDLSVVGF